MKVRSLRQFLHYLFLVVGIFSVIALVITVNTYLCFVEEGYGLECHHDQTTFYDNWPEWFSLRFHIVNPGGLDIRLEGGSITVVQSYDIVETSLPNGGTQSLPLSDLPKGESKSVMIWFHLPQAEMDDIMGADGPVPFVIDMRIFVPERDLWTHMVYEGVL
jgi:hypothetical protein